MNNPNVVKVVRVRETDNDSKCKFQKHELTYISAKKFKEKNKHNRNYIICGKILDSFKKKRKVFVIDYHGSKFVVCGTDAKAGPFKKVKGYVQVGDNEYVEIYKTNYLLVSGIIALVIALMVALWPYYGGYIKNLLGLNPTKEKEVQQLDENQHDYVDKRNIDHAKNVILPGWTKLTIPKDTTTIDKGVDLYNPEGNCWNTCPDCGTQLDENYLCTKESCKKQSSADLAKEDCYYMNFTLALEETDEVLYKSNLVAPGKHLQQIELNRPLEEGEYKAYILIQPYKSDMATPCNNGKVSITLIVK